MKKTFNGSLYLAIVFILLLLISVSLPSAVAYADGTDAENASYLFDYTDISEDLKGAGYSLDSYYKDSAGSMSIITFLEYGYDGIEDDKYALYIYIYNPQQLNIEHNTATNKANVAVEFDKSEATSYYRFTLHYCSSSADNLLYKWRIMDADNQLITVAKAYESAHGARRYDVASVELHISGSATASATKIGKSYEFSGTMKGFGTDKETNTLTCKAYSLDVLELELNHTFYRPEGNNSSVSDETIKDELSSVYFAFPNELINYYGGIYKIQASYYMAQTSPILVTSTAEVSAMVRQYLGKEIPEDPEYFAWGASRPLMINENLGFVLFEKLYDVSAFAWNAAEGYYKDPVYYLFYTGDYTDLDYAPYANTFTLSSEDLLNYILTYDESYNNGFADIVGTTGHSLSMDLFQGTLKATGKSGTLEYVPIEVTADDNYTLESYKRVPTAWDWFALYPGKYDYKTFSDINAIEAINPADVTLKKDIFCKKYYVDSSDYKAVINAVKSATANGETVYLFRFAQSEYKAHGVSTGGSMTLGTEYAYVAEQTVYLDMNIASVTCRKGDDYHTFAVCSNPINVTADSEPFVEFDNLQYYKDVVQKVKDKADETKRTLIIATLVVVCVAIVILILILSIKLAPQRDYVAQKRALPKKQKKPTKKRK